ncbi:MAG: type VI secretion system protein TssA [Acidobacteriia bacterium]|nr:type VI secretion system protein TssA [Terriglobia bacterium]
MPTAALYSDDLLGPISADQPAGADLRWTPEWDRIKEARRADDDLDAGKWAKKDRKTADWGLVRELSTTLLRERTKDLNVAMWLTEAGIRLHGFSGLRDGLRISRELMVRYWENGLFPAMEDGPEDRAGPFEWLNNKLVDAITAIPLTARSGQGSDYSLMDLQDARRTGSEASWRMADGEIDERKKKDYDKALTEGHVSQEMFERAVAESPRKAIEEVYADFRQACEEFRALEKAVDEKFGEAAPNLSACRGALRDIEQEFVPILERKRAEEPDAAPPPVQPGAAPAESAAAAGRPAQVFRFPLSVEAGVGAAGSSWEDAEALVRSGEVEKGLAEMTRLAAGETSGRNRFQRKLLLAEACLTSGRERLARMVLEELAEQIDKLQLEQWESSTLIAGVWIRLYRLYKKGGESNESDRAAKLYERLSRLDPWQALACSEG